MRLENPLPVEAIRESEKWPFPRGEWPATVPAVAQVLRRGLKFDRATILVGENGVGKSTLVEAVAMAFGLSSEGGSTGAQHRTRATESDLYKHLTLVRGANGVRWGYFVRAESMHGLFTYLEDNPNPDPRFPDVDFHRLSHGESFQALLATSRFRGRGFWVMDEPEAGLSFESQLALVGTLKDLLGQPGSQVLLATHSPIIAALPGARLLQLDSAGITEVTWDDLGTVFHYRSFLQSPQRYLRHL